MLGRDEVVLELRLLALGLVEDLLQRVRDARLHVPGAGRRRAPGELLLRLGAQALPVAEELLVEEREQQVLRVDLRVPALARQLLGGRDRLLSLNCQPIEIHCSLTSLDRLLHFCDVTWHRLNRHGDWVSARSVTLP